MSLNMDDDDELQLALRLSFQSFEDEQRQRANASPELLQGDPREIARQKNIDEITALFQQPSSDVPLRYQAGSCATLPYGFKPDFFAYQNKASSSNALQTMQQRNSVSPDPLEPYLQKSTEPPLRPLTLTAPSLQPELSSPGRNKHSPIYVPFRMQGDRMLDLDNTPRSLTFSCTTENRQISEASVSQDMVSDYPLDSILECLKPQAPPLKSTDDINRNTSTSKPTTSTEINGFKIIDGENAFARQSSMLRSKAATFHEITREAVFFIAPTVDYMTTSADSIKFKVFRDDTWPPNYCKLPTEVTLTFESSSTCEDLLIAVLARLLPPDDIGSVCKIEDYTLKMYGVDEFLMPHAIIGHHPFVGKFVTRCQDVPLQIGLRQMKHVNFQYFQAMFDRPDSLFCIDRKKLEEKLDAIFYHLESMEQRKHYSLNLRKDVISLVISLCQLCMNVMTLDVASALDTLLAADIESHYFVAKRNLINALHEMVTMISSGSHCDYVVESIVDESQLDIVESRNMDDEFMVFIESMHNISHEWRNKFRRYYVEVCLMYGTTTIGIKKATDHKGLRERHELCAIPINAWVLSGAQIMVLPREVRVCVMVSGVPLDPDKEVTKMLAYTSMPVFDFNGFLCQTKVMLPLTVVEQPVIQPWGPVPLLRSKTDVLIVLSFLKYHYRVRFPQQIEYQQITPVPFITLSESDQIHIMDLIDKRPDAHCISNDDKLLLWSNRRALMDMREALLPTLYSVDTWDSLSLSNIYPLLEKWSPPDFQFITELLLPFFQDQVVRRHGVEMIKRGSLDFKINLLPQLTESLRFELFENSALAEFLLESCTKDRRFATLLYWELEQRTLNEVPPFSTRCLLLLDLLMQLEIPNFVEDITCQKRFLRAIDDISDVAKSVQNSLITTQVQSLLYEINDKINITKLRMPINPGFLCICIDVEKCDVFMSATKPLKIRLIGEKSSYDVMYKAGDDLRQDAIVLQLVRLMNDLWLRENLDLRMLTYRVQPTGKNQGLIELVDDCQTLRQMVDKPTYVFRNDTISKWISRHNPSEFECRTAFDNFLRSCAGWCVVTYVLGIGDRHNDNILICKSGHVFHIDFGKYMGDFQTALGFNRDRVPFVLTPEMVFAINNGAMTNTAKFQEFSDYCCKAFNCLRHNRELLLNVIRFMSCSNVGYMNMHSVHFVEKNLVLSFTDAQATSHFTKLIQSSFDNVAPRLNFFVHSMAQQMAGGSTNSSKQEGLFSFTTDVYTSKTEPKIRTVNVISFEKWRTPTKYYMFHFEVFRINEKKPVMIHRTYEECQELHSGLAKMFGDAALPVLDTNASFMRSNTRQAAEQRQLALCQFFKRLIELPTEISQSDLVSTFFHTIHRDTNPEIVKDVQNHNPISTQLTSLQIKLSVERNKRMLHVFVSHARNLPLIGGTSNQPPDSYVKIYVHPSRLVTKQKSNVVRGTCNPTYNSSFTYAFDSPNDLKNSSLDVAIWQSSATIIRDNYRICGTMVPLAPVLQAPTDRKGAHISEQWVVLTNHV